MALHRQSINDPDGAAAYRRRIVKPFTKVGAAVLSLDHVVKDPDKNRGGYALGSVHKGNGLNGALFLLENQEAFGKGTRGVSHIFVTKDRPGRLRQEGQPTKISRKTILATMVVDCHIPENPEFHLYAPKSVADPIDDAAADIALRDRAWDILRQYGPLPTRALRAKLGGRTAAVGPALEPATCATTGTSRSCASPARRTRGAATTSCAARSTSRPSGE